MSFSSLSSSSVKAVVFGMLIGFVAAFGPSCGPVKPISRCSVSNCDGCCDSSGLCQQGTSDSNCGSAAATCISCDTGRQCLKLSTDSDFGGRCNGGTGSGTDGGVLRDAGVVDAGICNPSTCANGCCNGGTCVTVTSTARCGVGGAACAPCNSGNTCVSGACTPCNGCVDIATGQCKAGTEMSACGRTGGFCQSCDSSQGQTCSNGICGGGTSCNADNCPEGCCDGATCKPKSGYNQFQCGSGTPGTACVSCQSQCDLDAGTCIGGTSGDDGGFGFPGLGDCGPSSPCPIGECCQSLLGLNLCMKSGASVLIGKVCGSATSCSVCLFGSSCDTSTYTCQ